MLISIISYVRKCLYLFYRYFWPVIYVYLYSYIYRVAKESKSNIFVFSQKWFQNIICEENILSAYQVFSKQILKWHAIILHVHIRFRHDSMAAVLLFYDILNACIILFWKQWCLLQKIKSKNIYHIIILVHLDP